VELGLMQCIALIAPLAFFLFEACARAAEDGERPITVRFTVIDAETGRPVKNCRVGVCRRSAVPADPSAPMPLENEGLADESGVAEIALPESTPNMDRVFAFTCHAPYRNKVWPDAEFDRHLPLVGDAESAGTLDLTRGDAEVSLAITHIVLTVWVTASDGTKLATELWLPDGEGPWPVILERTPYGRGTFFDGRSFVQAGYAYVVQDWRGRFESEGGDLVFDGCGWTEHTDGRDTIEWIASQPWCNGRIGTHGGSAMGHTQNFLAGTWPEDLDAQYILVAFWHYYPFIYPGGVLRKALVEGWLESQKYSPVTLDTLRAHPAFDDFWQEREPDTRISGITYPAFHATGWFDCCQQGTIDGFVARQYRGAPGARGSQKLVIGPWPHSLWWSEEAGEIEFPQARDIPVPHDAVEWFDWQLKGESSAFESSPAAAYYRMGDTTDPDAPGNDWQTSEVWPVPAAETPLYLCGRGLLSFDPSDAAGAHATYVYDPENPVPTLGGQNLLMPWGTYDQRPVEDRPDVLVFTTEPLTESVEATGRLKVVLFASSDRVDTDFTAKLTDVYPDGRSMLLADGILRTRYRDSFSEPKLMEPGKVYRFEIDLWSTSIVFNKGHRIRLAVSSSNAPRFEPNHNTAERTDPPVLARNTIHFDADYPSRLVLPVVT